LENTENYILLFLFYY